MRNTFEVEPDEVEPDQVLQAAKRCEWAGVACLYALPVWLVANGYYSFDLNQLLGLPRAWEVGVNVMFLASWPLAAIGLLFRSCELRLEARARTPEQTKALRKVNVFRRVGVSGLLAVPVLLIWAVGFTSCGLLLPLLMCAGIWLSLRIGEMVRQVME